jgi:hypothetical protein
MQSVSGWKGVTGKSEIVCTPTIGGVNSTALSCEPHFWQVVSDVAGAFAELSDVCRVWPTDGR